MEKELKLILVFFSILILFSINSTYVQASVSDVGVEYDEEIIGQFLTSEWVSVMIDVKDFSNITINKNDSVEIETIKDNMKWSVYKNTSDAVLSNLSEEEFILERKSDFDVFFSGNISKEGFEKLLRDERVLSISIKKGGSLHTLADVTSANGMLIFFLPAVLIIILIILLVKLNRKRQWKKR